MHKDIRLALKSGRELSVPLPSAAVTDGLLGRAEQLGYGRRDIAALFQVLAQTAPAGVAGAAGGEAEENR